MVAGIYSLLRWGMQLSIDFTGGTIIQIQNVKLQDQIGTIQKFLEEKEIEVVSFNISKESINIKTKPIEREKWVDVKNQLEDDYGEIEELQFETVGPVLGKELLQKTAIAALLAVFGILFYIAYVFKDVKYGLSAIFALLHDLLVVAGTFSLLGHFYGIEIDTLFVTAILTTMSFSVHDTIVVFDRIRESIKSESLPLDITINKALTETMSRSVNNSMTIVFMLLALVLLGGETIKWFVVALLIGIISGTYSSPFVATPILYYLRRKGGEKK